MRNFITFFLLGLFLIPYSLVLALVYPFSKKAAKKMSDFCVKKVPVGVFGVLYKIDQFHFFGYEESKAQLPPNFMIICNHQSLFDIPAGVDKMVYLKSAIFATFMMAITFNGFNARTEHLNLFKGIFRNVNFLLVMFGIFAMQFVFVTFGGEFLNVHSLTSHSWLVCVILAVIVIPIDMIRKLFVLAFKKK